MQFIGAKGITLFVAIVLIACGAGFGSGLLVGRQYPTRAFQKYGDTRFLLDPIAGKLCDPFKNPTANVVDQSLTNSSATPTPPPGFVLDGTRDANGFQIVKPAQPDYPPACGK